VIIERCELLELDEQPLANLRECSRLIHSVKMQTGYAAVSQLIAEVGNHIEAEGFDGGCVVRFRVAISSESKMGLDFVPTD
jgi:hypothetical protein